MTTFFKNLEAEITLFDLDPIYCMFDFTSDKDGLVDVISVIIEDDNGIEYDLLKRGCLSITNEVEDELMQQQTLFMKIQKKAMQHQKKTRPLLINLQVKQIKI